MSAEKRLEQLGIKLPPAPAPKGNYVPSLIVGDLLYLSGVLPIEDGKVACTGPVGSARTIEEGQKAARLCTLNALASARAALGSLDRIEQVVSVTGFVLGVPNFAQSPAVVNGASDTLVEILGDAGRHTRAAVSVSGLPLEATVEIQMVFKIGK